ncbi:MAG: hypothetical protein MUO91_02475 [candidate division Zixibacteria bacterium]|nr:hypothetical protein [candidate division Zixibacteria bacterium]
MSHKNKIKWITALNKMRAAKLNSASRFIGTCPSGHITADKRLRYASPKSRLGGTSFIRKTIEEEEISLCL